MTEVIINTQLRSDHRRELKIPGDFPGFSHALRLSGKVGSGYLRDNSGRGASRSGIPTLERGNDGRWSMAMMGECARSIMVPMLQRGNPSPDAPASRAWPKR